MKLNKDLLNEISNMNVIILKEAERLYRANAKFNAYVAFHYKFIKLKRNTLIDIMNKGLEKEKWN